MSTARRSRSIRGVTRLVGASADMLFDAVERYVKDEPSSHEREAVLAALNGIFGDYLSNTRNPLAVPMRLRTGLQRAVRAARDGAQCGH